MVLGKTEVLAKNTSISVGVRKMALVTRLISGLSVTKAIDILMLSHKSCAKDILNVLNSAVKNALDQLSVDDVTNLYIKEIKLGRGRKMKRFMPRARGRSSRIEKHSSNLVVIVGKY